jgi:dipeptidyl aminopeptidase/acylaminoacyl peptidase
MVLFRRMLRWLFWLTGFMVGAVVSMALFFARYMIMPPRQRLWATPADVGLAYENVHFPAQDGVRLAGWFIPAGANSRRKGATILLAHGWPWNRLGNGADDLLSKLSGSPPLHFLRLAHALQGDGYHVFMFDLRNHGESAAAPPVTFGWQEAKDLLGAMTYVGDRADTDSERTGVVGFSMGANTILYALPQTDKIKAAVAVQPTSLAVFARRYGADLVGPLSKVVAPLTEWLYRAAGGSRFTAVQPSFAALGAGETPVLFVQGKGDRWGSVADVAQMAGAVPQARGPLFVDTTHRFGGYQYIIDNPKIVTAFFEQHLPE